MKPTTKLRALLEEDEIIVAPGCYDCWSAKLIEKSGFKAAYMTGYGVSASLLGRPDTGFLTMTEMVNQARNIAAAIDIPLIADADNGYGNAMNVKRTVEEYEKAGVAAIHLEDQIFPKRCGHSEGKQVISAQAHAKKIEMAVKSRKDPDFLIIARTDARAIYGIDEAIKRGKLYAEAGADMVFIDAPLSKDELRKISDEIEAPLFVNMVEEGKTPLLTNQELQDMGFKIVIYPVSVLFSITPQVLKVLKVLKEEGTTKGMIDQLISFDEFNEIIGFHDYYRLEQEYVVE